jgi:hypothetical protein
MENACGSGDLTTTTTDFIKTCGASSYVNVCHDADRATLCALLPFATQAYCTPEVLLHTGSSGDRLAHHNQHGNYEDAGIGCEDGFDYARFFQTSGAGTCAVGERQSTKRRWIVDENPRLFRVYWVNPAVTRRDTARQPGTPVPVNAPTVHAKMRGWHSNS